MTAPSFYQGLFFGFIAAFFWGTHSVIVRFLTNDLGGLAIACIRLYIAAICLGLFLKIRGYPIRVDVRSPVFWWTTVAATVNFVFFHVGLEYTDAHSAILLENTAPIFVIIGMFLIWRWKIRWAEICAVALVVFGAYYTVRESFGTGGDIVIGDIMEIVAGLVWAVFIVGSSRALSTSSSINERVNFLFGVFLVSAILMTPFLFFSTYHVTLFDGVLLVLLGVFPTAFAFIFWYEAAARVSTVTAALLFSLSIIFTFIFAAIFLGEEIRPDMMIGGALIILGVGISKFSSPQSAAKKT
ncbi:DMT family transporter [Sneathiella marina]|uniref:DMT family transporter n=1 Tax=Sneathiella marina TaxID=2950108 RepID=A0ABY4W9U5_9PROT|nr:DMT family transporter [Sneathiella marina]USG62672.1 DMT family transporter [Sneathiella marina]